MKKAIIQNLPALDAAQTEALNTIITNLLYAKSELKKIIFTSCDCAEDKDALLIQLAQALGKQGKKTVLIDADLRQNGVSALYGMDENEAGLAQYLTNRCELSASLHDTDTANLTLLPAGKKVANSALLLSGEQTETLLKACAAQFDLVLINTSGGFSADETGSFAPLCDGIVLVARDHLTHSRKLHQTKQTLEKTGCPVIGCIVTGVRKPAAYA
ncbi:MAG: CpsD/CapB family tyrosine-protein kinase [Clostridia bacterium]|nr:CpsD/CapB family tyrosine-protein kinase [Clostridia bacterium]